MTATAKISRRTKTAAATKDIDLIVDNFAGGGGASLGIKWATGREPDYAVNHDVNAIIMHRENHPGTAHLCESVYKVKPAEVVGKGRVALAWFSPDCTHFSIARGAKPVSPRVRGLAWVVIKWAKLPKKQRPRVIILENVKEFVTWGPLVKKRDAKGKVMLDSAGRELEIPCPKRKGVTFKRWATTLRNLGYSVEWREINAADYGAPTMRKRFFLIARCDGKPITWPEPTHYDPKKKRNLFEAGMTPYRTAAECIDWSEPCPSIFMTSAEAKQYKKLTGRRVNRPLKKATQQRLANGLLRFVMRARRPYIIPTGYGERTGQQPRVHDIDAPSPTNVGSSKHAVVVPVITPVQHASSTTPGKSAGEPLNTITSQPKGGGFALMAAHLVQVNHGGADDRSRDLREPLPTITEKHGYGLSVAFLAKHYGGMVGVELPTPFPTTTARGTQNQIVAADLVKLRGTSADGQSLDGPAPAISAQGQHEALGIFYGTKYYRTAVGGQNLDEPSHTVTAKHRLSVSGVICARATNRLIEHGVKKVRAFIAKYLGHLDLTEKERLGIVTINGEDWQICFIGMRMLTPRELARCQGFPDDYILTGTKTNQVARIGNSVCPHVVEALVRANVEVR